MASFQIVAVTTNRRDNVKHCKVSCVFDYNGNTQTMVNSSGTTTYSWDFENRLASVSLPASGGTVYFKYDPFGRRIYKSSSSGTSIYAYDGDNLVEETNSAGTAVARYSQGLNIDEPLAMLRSSTTSYYQADGLGSVTSLSDTSGNLPSTYTYDSFGNLVATSGSIVNNFRYTGREFDSETGVYYYRARYYDPNVGRFLSEDPLHFVAGINFYPYALNAPVNLRDPSGKNAGAIAIPIAGTICFGSGVCETVIVVGGVAITVGVAAVLTYNYLASRTRAKADPIPWPGIKKPGQCDDEPGKCKPCPPDSPYWEQEGNAHGSTTGVHFHWWHWNQKPYPDCTCYPSRLDGANPPPGGTPWTPGAPAWP